MSLKTASVYAKYFIFNKRADFVIKTIRNFELSFWKRHGGGIIKPFSNTAQKMNFIIRDFFSKYEQICKNLIDVFITQWNISAGAFCWNN